MKHNGNTTIDVLVIGGGQAGLAIGYYLEQSHYSYIILENEGRIGNSWRKRYDSLVLFSPRALSALPGLLFKGEKDGYPSKNEVADYLLNYTSHFNIRVLLETKVGKLEMKDNHFIVSTNHGEYRSKSIVVATGAFQKPFIPNLPGKLNPKILTIHSSEYKSPREVRGERVLVVGSGNSAAQIAVELSKSFAVTISTRSKLRYIREIIAGKSFLWWLHVSRFIHIPSNSWVGKFLQSSSEPIVGETLKDLIKSGKIKTKPTTQKLMDEEVMFTDSTHEHFDTIIFATGFKSDYSWISVQGAFGGNTHPLQTIGVSNTPGLFFLGLSNQRSRASALLLGIGRDASHIFQELKLFLK